MEAAASPASSVQRPDGERELAQRVAARRRHRRERQHRPERAADGDDQDRQPADDGKVQVDEQPAAVDDPGHRVVAAREHERSEQQCGRDVQAHERHAGAADDERPVSRRPPHEPEQLREHEHESRGHERCARPEERRAVERDAGRDEEAARKERQGQSAGAAGAGRRCGASPAAGETTRPSRRTAAVRARGDERRAPVASRAGRGRRARARRRAARSQPAIQPASATADVRREQTERDRAADRPAVAERDRLRSRASAQWEAPGRTGGRVHLCALMKATRARTSFGLPARPWPATAAVMTPGW